MTLKIKMTKQKRTFFILSFLLILIIAGIIGSTFYAIGFMQKKSLAISDIKAQNDLFDERSVAAQVSKKQLVQYKSFDAVADRILPKDKAQSNSLVEINKLANNQGLTVLAITYSDGKPVASGASTSTTATTAPKLSQTFPVDGLPNILGMQVNVTYSNAIPYSKLLSYLESIEKNQRKIQITSLELQNFDPAHSLVQLKSASMRFYLKP